MKNAPYKNLLTYKYALIINDFTRAFTKRYTRRFGSWRDEDQMNQAARSGKQCIEEGATQGTSLKGYLKMLGVTRGSFEELREDYLDIARRLNISVWDKGDMRWRRYRIYISEEQSVPPIPPIPPDMEIFTNVMIDILTRENYLLDQQIRSLVEKHKKEGGFTEKLYRERKRYRSGRSYRE